MNSPDLFSIKLLEKYYYSVLFCIIFSHLQDDSGAMLSGMTWRSGGGLTDSRYIDRFSHANTLCSACVESPSIAI